MKRAEFLRCMAVAPFATQALLSVSQPPQDAALDGVMDGMVRGRVTGHATHTSAMTSLDQYADDEFAGRLMTFVSGGTSGQVATILGHRGGRCMTTPFQTVPSAGDYFVVC